MTNFATYIDSTNDHAPIAQRGRAKQRRADLRLVGLGMVVTRARRRDWDSAGIPRLPRQPPRRHPVRHHQCDEVARNLRAASPDGAKLVARSRIERVEASVCRP